LLAVLLLGAGCATGVALGWAVLSVRAVALATLCFLTIVIFIGLHYGLAGSTIAVVLITGITLLQTSYIGIMILCSGLKQTELPTPTPLDTETWAARRRG
jgi:hypothetical protein